MTPVLDARAASAAELPLPVDDVLAAAGVGLWTIDVRSGRVWWSESNERLWGLPAGTFAGTVDAACALFAPDDLAALMQAMHRTTPEAPGFTAEFRVGDAAAARWLRSTGRMEFESDGRQRQASGITLDVTSEKRQQSECLQTRRLVALGRLAGGVAHDFNNLLTAIIGFSELVEDALPAGHLAAADVAEIQRAAHSAALLTRRLLTFGRHGEGGVRPVDVNETIGSLQQLLRRTIGENIRLALTLGAQPAHVRIDPVQLEQLLMNLLVNARDAMATGGTIVVSTSNFTGADAAARPAMVAGDYIAIRVADNGCGMPDEVRERAFEAFFTTKERGGGTGLGLATVLEIVKRAGGSIALDSHVGHGTTVMIYVPQTDEAILEMRCREEAPVDPGPPATVLVVEDDTSLRNLAVRTLSARGYITFAAASAEEAVTLIEQKLPHIDLLLADVMLPGASGCELQRRLIDLWPGLKTVFMSGYSAESLQQLRLLDGATPLLEKPFTPRVLAQQVAQALGNPEARTSSHE
jgi:signal transduction histidine kinase/CheY-like chemotaxis protein